MVDQALVASCTAGSYSTVAVAIWAVFWLGVGVKCVGLI